MQTKLLEIRDRGTTISALALRLVAVTEAERYLVVRAGYGSSPDEQRQYVLLLDLNGGAGEFHSDPYAWRGGRTLHLAQLYINEHFDQLESGQVIDIEFLCGETQAPKEPERLRHVETSRSGV
jgi:hypothetical protein